MNNHFDAEFAAAAAAFNQEVFLCCEGIGDVAAREYSRDYARMLVNRAKGTEFEVPRIPHSMFEPTRNLIRSILDTMFKKHFHQDH